MKDKLLLLPFALFLPTCGGQAGNVSQTLENPEHSNHPISPLAQGGGGVSSTNAPKYIDDAPDPLASYLWQFKNEGQTSYSSLPTATTSGADINLGSIHDYYRGESQTVVVVDGRIDLDHPDLSANTDLTRSKNYVINMKSGVSPTSSDDTDFHGTGVMGLVGAVRGNGQGAFGVAPLAKLIGINFLDGDQTLSQEQDMAKSVAGAVYNFSFGTSTCMPVFEDSSYLEYLQWLSMSDDHVYVTSAGNDFRGQRSMCGESGGYIGNGNLNQVKSHPYLIVSAAMNNQGVRASYSTSSSNNWISAPGGESYSGSRIPLLTTDLEGCSRGQARSSSSVAFDKNQFGNNPNCAYVTDGVAGTSFASPIVAGAVALILENLEPSNRNARTVKHILANSAKKVDPLAGNTEHPEGIGLSHHIYQFGWITNAAGYHFHNWYGFGLLDVTSAIHFAQAFQGKHLPTVKFTYLPGGDFFYQTAPALNLSIPDQSAIGVNSQLNVDSHDLNIEHVLVKVNIAHPYPGDLGIELTSPSGTISKLMNVNSNTVGSNLVNVTLGSNAFYGEKSKGLWTLRVVDGEMDDVGKLLNWSIHILGSREGTGTKPQSVSNISHSGNAISWTRSPSAIVRYEANVRLASSSSVSEAVEWFPIRSSANSYVVTKYSNLGWKNIVKGSSYKISIRSIDAQENESSVTSYTWLAGS